MTPLNSDQADRKLANQLVLRPWRRCVQRIAVHCHEKILEEGDLVMTLPASYLNAPPLKMPNALRSPSLASWNQDVTELSPASAQ